MMMMKMMMTMMMMMTSRGDYAERASKKEELEARLADLNGSLHEYVEGRRVV
jgi:hypothetical protein